MAGVDVEPTVAAQRFVGYGQTKFGPGPICFLDVAGTEYVAEPHVTWFPWVSPSERILSFKWAVKYLAESREVLLTVQKDQISFFEHFVKRGFLRKVGYIKDLPIVGEVHMYQYERTKQ